MKDSLFKVGSGQRGVNATLGVFRRYRCGLTLCVVFLAIASGTPRKGNAQDLRETVDSWSFFDDEPGWLLGLRPAVGYDPDWGAFPQLGVRVAYEFADHILLGGDLVGRFTFPYHIRFGPRLGVFYRGADVAFGTGTTPGLMGIFETGEFGAVLTWGIEGRVRLDRHNFLALYVEVDLLYQILGFRRTRWFVSGGLGWTHTF